MLADLEICAADLMQNKMEKSIGRKFQKNLQLRINLRIGGLAAKSRLRVGGCIWTNGVAENFLHVGDVFV